MSQKPKLMSSAYDLSSIGIGVQKAVIELLMEERESTKFLEEALRGGMSGNLIFASSILPITFPESWGEEDGKNSSYFSEYASEIKSKDTEVREESEKLDKIIIRSALIDELTINEEDFTFDEHTSLVQTLFDKELTKLEAQKIYEKRNSRMGWITALYKSGEVNKEKINLFIENKDKYYGAPELKKRLTQFHIKKLDYMVYIFEKDLKISGFDGNNSPFEDTSKWIPAWKKTFNDDLPTPYQLIESAKGAIDRAKQYLTSL